LIQLELDAYNVPLTALSRLPNRRMQERLRPLVPLRGVAELHAIATGNATAPSVQLSASVDDLVVRGLPLGRLNASEVELLAAEGKLRILEADLVQHHADHVHQLRVSGELPFSWALPGIPPDKPRDLTLTLPDQPVEVANELLKATQEQGGEGPASLAELGVAGGTVAGEIHLKGTSRAPENSGYLAIRQASVNLPGDTSIENLEGTLRFTGNEVLVERLVGGSSRSGGFMVTGRALLGGAGPQLELALQINQFRFAEEHLERFNPALKGLVAHGTFQTVDRDVGRDPEPLRVSGPWNRPKISGGLRLVRATSGLPPDVPPHPSAKLAIDPELDVRVFVGNEVAIRNPLVEMRLDGSLMVANTLSAPVITGRLTVPRGTLQMPTMRFRIEGSIRVAYDARPSASSSAAPIFVDLTGVSHVSWRETLSQPAEDIQVVMTVRGSPGGGAAGGYPDAQRSSVSGEMVLGGAQGLSVELHSDPPVASDQLASLIRQQLGVEGFSANDSNLQSVLRQQVQLALANSVAPLFTSRLEDYLQQALKLDVLSIEVGGIEEPLQLRLGKRFIGGLYGSVLQQIGTAGESSQSWELYYRMTRGLRLGMRREEPSSRDLFFLSGSLRFR
jgi:hypothetical protein